MLLTCKRPPRLWQLIVDRWKARLPKYVTQGSKKQAPIITTRKKKGKGCAFPFIHRNIVSMAQNCKDCTLAVKNPITICTKEDTGKNQETREPDEAIQLNFWGPINYHNESRNCEIAAVDSYSRWPQAMVCKTNRTDTPLKFLRSYINNHGVPMKIHDDQGTNFIWRSSKFSAMEGITVAQSPVNDHCATGCFDPTKRSLKKSILTYFNNHWKNLIT